MSDDIYSKEQDQQSLEHHLLHPVADAEPALERLFFNYRPVWLLLALVLTAFLGYQATKVRPDASFEKMIPTNHPYIANYLDSREELAGLGNAVRISVEAVEGDIFTRQFQDSLKRIHDEVFFIPGVDRSALKSLWASAVRWSGVTEEGFEGGPVIPDSYDGSEASLARLRDNVLKSGQVGGLVANNFKSAVILAPLLDMDPETGEKLDYRQLSERLETLVRDKYQSESIKIHITGFAKVVGDLIDGASQVVLFFMIALGITLVLLYLYSRCLRSTLIPLLCSVTAVVWQLGILHTLGYGLDPYSMLVPFLVFAIGVSHGVQIINTIAHESLKGADARLAARRAFRLLYIPGLTALVSDGIGFTTLMVIEIAVIQDLAVAASIGVAVVILTNLVLLPVLISYSGVSAASIRLLDAKENRSRHPVWKGLSHFTRPKLAALTTMAALLLFGFGLYGSQGLQIGDLDAGAPELRPDSRYNRDNAFMAANYSASTDIFVVMAKTAVDQCSKASNLYAIDRLQWQLQQLPGVQSVDSMAKEAKLSISAMNEGNLKWYSILSNDAMTNAAAVDAPPGSFNRDCSMVPVRVFLNDHKAKTLQQVVETVETFARENRMEEGSDVPVQLLMAAGNAGIEAATNIVIEKSQYEMLAWVYGVVSLLCLLTFRSLRTVLCIILPLALTSVLCQALMTYLGIGVKVATLPVIALGVGIGVDYGIYIYSKLETYLAQGMELQEAYFNTLKTTGKAVAFTGLTLAIGVGTWVFSPIKFQADMGILLTFMFLLNMLGALILLPAMATLLVKTKTVTTLPSPEPEDDLPGIGTACSTEQQATC